MKFLGTPLHKIYVQLAICIGQFKTSTNTHFETLIDLIIWSFNLINLSLFVTKVSIFVFNFSLGAHTIGFSHCGKFSKRIYNFSPKTRIDPSLNRNYALQLRQMCPLKVDPRIAINMDPNTPQRFDNVYYQNLQQGKGLLGSDQILHEDKRSKPTVDLFASSNSAFQQAFITAITKLGRVGVLTGNKGEIRRDCTAVN